MTIQTTESIQEYASTHMCRGRPTDTVGSASCLAMQKDNAYHPAIRTCDVRMYRLNTLLCTHKVTTRIERDEIRSPVTGSLKSPVGPHGLAQTMCWMVWFEKVGYLVCCSASAAPRWSRCGQKRASTSNRRWVSSGSLDMPADAPGSSTATTARASKPADDVLTQSSESLRVRSRLSP